MKFFDIDNILIENIKKQNKKKEELTKIGTKVVNTNELVKGKKYRPVLSKEGHDEFILVEIVKIKHSREHIRDSPVNKVGGKLYKVKIQTRMFTFWTFEPTLELFENELFVLVEDNSKKVGSIKKRNSMKMSKKRGSIKKRNRMNLY